MNIRGLKLALKEELTSLFKQSYPVKMPSVFIDSLPKKKYEDENTLFPFVQIVAEDAEFFTEPTNGQNLVKVSLAVGVNDEDENSPEVDSIIDKIFHYIAEHKVIAN